MRRSAAAAAACACLAFVATGCGGERESTTAAIGEFGSYPADKTLDEKEVVEAYVAALDARDGARFCGVVAPWISGMFDIYGTDPEAPLSHPLRCPEWVSGFIGYIEDCCPPEFLGAEVVDMGELDRRGELVGVPVTVDLTLKGDDGEFTEPIEDIVWVTRDAGAWRVAGLSRVAGEASIILDSEGDLESPPDLAAVRASFAAAVAEAEQRRREYEASYRAVGADVSCPGATRYGDGAADVVDYRHPAPPTPTPQLGSADLHAMHVHASESRMCSVFELRGDIRRGTTFEVAVETPDFESGRGGFSQGFQVELRADGRARVTSGQNDDRSISVPAKVGLDGNRLALFLDDESFSTGRAYPASAEPGRLLTRFLLRASVTVELSDERHLHDDLGPSGAEGIDRFPYPQI